MTLKSLQNNSKNALVYMTMLDQKTVALFVILSQKDIFKIEKRKW